MKKLTGLFINPFAKTMEQRTIDRNLKSYYKLLNEGRHEDDTKCNLIEIAYIPIQDTGQTVLVIIDEEGWIGTPLDVTAIKIGNYETVFAGSVFIISAENIDGEFESIKSEEVEALLKADFKWGYVDRTIGQTFNPVA